MAGLVSKQESMDTEKDAGLPLVEKSNNSLSDDGTNEAVCTRSLSDINSILEFAKLDPSNLKPTVQTLYFCEHLDNEGFKLLEVDESVLEALQCGKQVKIRGDANDSAVLVTDDMTFDIKEAETSNSMLLLPRLSFGSDLASEGEQVIVKEQVTSVVHNYFELRAIKPRLRKLQNLLESNPYRGRECEGDENDVGKKYTYEELQNCVQASDEELKAGLTRMNACELQGHWRLLDFEYSATVLYHIVQLCEERDWLTEGVNVDECCQVLEDLFPREVIQHMVRYHGTDDGSSMETSDTNIVFLCKDKICRHYAELCLRNSGKFNLNDFLRAWQESVPVGMETSLAQIEGMALIERDSKPEVIWYYSVEDLPEDVSDRFETLFEEKKKWSLEEITPFVKDLTDEKTDVGGLLTKYARASLHNGIKMFSSRKTS